ncbi:MAG: glycosyltransferase family 2 protein, partial [Terriglobales bacterium]
MTDTRKASVDLSIGIVSGSNPAYTLDCVKSVFASLTGEISVAVIVVDNASQSRLDLQLNRLYPEISVRRNEERKGFGANHNAIIESIDARYYLLLNDDTLVHHGCFEQLVAAGDAHPEAGFIGPKLINGDGSHQASVFRFPSPKLALAEALLLDKVALLDNYSRFDYSSVRFVEYLSGAALMVRKETIEQIGLLDEGFFMYAEECDWALRGWRAGWKSLFVPHMTVMHYGGQSTVELRPERSVEFLRSHSRLIRKHFGASGLALYKLLMLLKHAPR